MDKNECSKEKKSLISFWSIFFTFQRNFEHPLGVSLSQLDVFSICVVLDPVVVPVGVVHGGEEVEETLKVGGRAEQAAPAPPDSDQDVAQNLLSSLTVWVLRHKYGIRVS